jgi:hypothetical protein
MNARRKRCLCCKELFEPEARSQYHQRFCSRTACRKASKALSQRRWHQKPENRNYWQGAEQVARVKAWRRANRNKKIGAAALLQEDCVPRNPLLVGLIATLVESALQEDIAAVCRRLVTKGEEILKVHRRLVRKRNLARAVTANGGT